MGEISITLIFRVFLYIRIRIPVWHMWTIGNAVIIQSLLNICIYHWNVIYFANFVRLSYFIFICYTHDTYVVYRKNPKDFMMTTRNLRLLFDFLPYLNVPLYKRIDLISVGSKSSNWRFFFKYFTSKQQTKAHGPHPSPKHSVLVSLSKFIKYETLQKYCKTYVHQLTSLIIIGLNVSKITKWGKTIHN